LPNPAARDLRARRSQQIELARVLERPRGQIRRAIETLMRGGVLSAAQGRYRLTGALTIDVASNPERERAVRMYSANVAGKRLRAPAESDLFSYNVFRIGRDDLATLQALQRDFSRSARALIAGSEPTELAVLLVVHSLVWDPNDGRASGVRFSEVGGPPRE
jgi:hypothetical protein